MPADEVRREALKVEPPVVAVVCSADLAGDRARGEAGFDHAIRADQALPGKRIDLQRVPHVGVQQLEDWVHCAHSPLRCQDEWLHNSMCPQPVVYKLMNAGVIGADMSFGKHPEPIRGSVIGRGQDLARPRQAWLAWRKTKFNSNWFQCASLGKEQNCPGCICLPSLYRINPVQERQEDIMVV